MISPFVSVDEILQEERNVSQLQIAALAAFGGRRQPRRPATSFRGIEADHADRVLELAGEQIPNDGFQIGHFVIGFRPDAAVAP